MTLSLVIGLSFKGTMHAPSCHTENLLCRYGPHYIPRIKPLKRTIFQSYKRMQSDQNARYALILTADAGR